MAKGGPTVGLDIGSSLIKVAEVVSSRNGFTVRALGSAPTPPGAMESNVIIDAQLLGQAVKRLLKEAGVGTGSSVSSVSGQSALVVRVIEVPQMSETELAETMKWEVERHVPFAANEVIMDFQPINRRDTPADAQNMEVLLAVAQQDMVDQHVAMLMAAGLKPAAIDVEPLAMSRSLIESGPDAYTSGKTIALINIGASNTDIGIFRDGLLAFPRTLPLAGDTFTRAISAQLGVGEEQAEELKKKFGEVIMDQVMPQQAAPMNSDDAFLDFSAPPSTSVPVTEATEMPFDFSASEEKPAPITAPVVEEESGFVDFGGTDAPAAPPSRAPLTNVPAPVAHDPQKLQVFSAIAPVLGELMTELRRSLEYYRGRSMDGRIDEIILCGGTAKLKNLDLFLQSELGIPTRVANPAQYGTVAARNYSAEHVAEIIPLFSVAIGLALRDMIAAPAMASAGGRRGKK